MTRAPDFSHEVEIRVTLPRLHAFLCDLHNYVPLHPLIESIEEIERIDELPNARRFRVVDRIPLGPLRLRTEYIAALDPVSDTEVHGHAWQSPGVRLHTVYTLSPHLRSSTSGASTRLEERVSIKAPLGLRRFVKGQARASHLTMLHDMKKLLEADSVASR